MGSSRQLYMITRLDFRRTSSSPGLSSRDDIRILSEKDVLIDTSVEEKALYRSGDNSGVAEILGRSSINLAERNNQI